MSFRDYLALVRFSHTVFALPFALASMVLAAQGLPSWGIVLKIILAVVFCRNTAMAFNRWADARLDARNPRTQNRHIPSGAMSRNQVLVFLLINAALFVVTTYWINSLAFALSVPTLLVICFYSLTKRFTRYSHLFLGLAVGLSPLGAWVAVTGRLDGLPVLLGICLMLWVAGFDIIYATQDEAVDRQLGLHSMVAALGAPTAVRVAKALHLVLIFVLWEIQWGWGLGWPYILSVWIITALIVYIHFFKKRPSLESLNDDFFLANAAISLCFMLGIFISVGLGWPIR